MVCDENVSSPITFGWVIHWLESVSQPYAVMKLFSQQLSGIKSVGDRIPSTTPGAEPPRDAKDSGSARSHSTHLETSSSNRP